jgi:hypothetical protein
VRCPQCGSFFCRECVVEHGGRLVCSSCLAAQVARGGKQPKRVRNWRPLREAVGLGLAVLVVLLCFHLLGTLLLRVPSDVHEGTLWRHLSEGGPQ